MSQTLETNTALAYDVCGQHAKKTVDIFYGVFALRLQARQVPKRVKPRTGGNTT
jgi:hypothetical protein